MGATVQVTKSGRLAVIRLAREHANAINQQLVDDLAAAAGELEADASVRGVLLTGAGKIFCPGLDLIELSEYPRDAMEAFMAGFGDLMLRLFVFPKPLVAGVGGHALAGGCVLAMTADWKILKAGAFIGLNEIRVGVALPLEVTQLLRGSVPPGRLEEVALVGRNFMDHEAVAAGLAHELRDAEGFEDACLARLEEFASKDPLAYLRTKRYLRSELVERAVVDRALHRREFIDSWFSEGTKRRVAEIVAGLKKR